MTCLFRVSRALLIAALLQSLAFIGGNAASASTAKTLYSFCSADACTDGLTPYSGLTHDSAGNLYGVVEQNGGNSNHGLAYALLKDGDKYKYVVIHRFCQDEGCTDGDEPSGNLIVDVNGIIYGTTLNAGENGGGTVYKLTPNANKKKWTLKTLHSFCYPCATGGEPNAGLTYQGAQSGLPYDGTSPLYGVTLYGGANSSGVAFSLSFEGKNPKYTVLHDFCLTDCSDGKQPESAMVMDADGNLFGTTRDGGSGFGGTVFEISPKGSGYKTTILHQFCQEADCTDGKLPRGTLNIDGSGNLIGTAVEGGVNGLGTGLAYRLSKKGQRWVYTVLYNFCSIENCTDGGQPQGGVLDVNGDLIGTATYGGDHDNGGSGGTVFKLHDKDLTTLYSFCTKKNCNDGSNPVSGVALDADDNVFGVTNSGGQNHDGVVFEVMP